MNKYQCGSRLINVVDAMGDIKELIDNNLSKL